MSLPRLIQMSVTTDASGDATVHSGTPVNGEIRAIEYVPDGTSPLDTGADLTFTGRTTGTAVLTVSNIGTSRVKWAPRMPTHSVAAGAAALYAAGGTAVNEPNGVPLANEELKLVVAQGGNAKLGTINVWVC